MMFCRPNILPAIVHPTKCCVNNSYSENMVPHIHPAHTTNVHHEKFNHVHYFPHTQSAVNEVSHQHFYGGSGPVSPSQVSPMAGPYGGPMSGPVGGAMSGPMGMGPRPGFKGF
ncbi:spore coat protein [Bacillus massilinigeriensis]|uniref:spore coat protein n=1 Tax=Bacillus mediterraneensis TaxID=1805474 RepID=UPI000ACE72EB|nr:spore coat protein [Bacillus mediterraneensis]